jgi:hypothetical protein
MNTTKMTTCDCCKEQKNKEDLSDYYEYWFCRKCENMMGLLCEWCDDRADEGCVCVETGKPCCWACYDYGVEKLKKANEEK